MKYPLNLYVVWHPESEICKTISEDLYSSFCRNFTNPLSRGMGISIYFRTVKLENNKPLPIDTSESAKNAIVILIDEAFFLDDDFRAYTKDLVSLINADTRVFPVSLFDRAHEIGAGLDSLQFIRGTLFNADPLNLSLSEDLDKAIRKIRAEVLHDCARLLMDFKPSSEDKEEDRIGSPVKLFLSHAKNDG